MTDEQVKHIVDLLETVKGLAFDKYAAGAAQHGGNLWEKDPVWLLDQAIDEAIDQFTYLLTLKSLLSPGVPPKE